MPAHSGPSGDLPQAFDEIKLAFIYVPDGLPPPWEWMALYPDHIKMPATYVPRASGVGASNRSFGAPPPGQHGPADGRVAPSGPRAPSVPAGNAASDAMSAPTHAIDDRTLNPNGPINAFRLADAGLRTAASDYSFANSGVSEIHANVASNQFGFVDPSGPSINLSDPIRGDELASGLSRISGLGSPPPTPGSLGRQNGSSSTPSPAAGTPSLPKATEGPDTSSGPVAEASQRLAFSCSLAATTKDGVNTCSV